MIKKGDSYHFTPEEIESKKRTSYFDGVSESTVVYRIFTAERFFQLWESSQITFVKPTLWEDPYENIFLHTIVEKPDGSILGFNNLVEDLYSQCWTTCPESDALWRIYSPDKTGIMVKSTAGKIISSFFDNLLANEHFEKEGLNNYIRAGKVVYLQEDQIYELIHGKVKNIVKTFSIK